MIKMLHLRQPAKAKPDVVTIIISVFVARKYGDTCHSSKSVMGM